MRLDGRRILYASSNHGWSLGWTWYQMWALALGETNDVLYVDAPRSLARLRLRDLRLAAGARARRVSERVLVFESVTRPAQRDHEARLAAARSTAARVARWCRRRGWSPNLLWAFSPYDLPLADRFPHAQLVYSTGDEVVIPGEEALLERADAIFCVSDPTYERHRSRYGERVHFTPVAIDFDRYHHELVHPSPHRLLDGFERPIAGYSGFVTSRIDVELVLELARALSAGTVALAGPVLLAGDEEAALRAEPRVELLGALEPEKVPAFVRDLDLGLLPYRDTAFNRGSNPVKFYEYLALGKPVAATDVPTLRRHAAVASVGARATFVDRALALLERDDGSPEERVAVAAAHSFPSVLDHFRSLPG